MDEMMTDAGRYTESAAWFRAGLEPIGESQSSFARLMIALGDNRSFSTIVRHVQRLASGAHIAGPEMRGIMNLLGRKKRKSVVAAKARAATIVTEPVNPPPPL